MDNGFDHKRWDDVKRILLKKYPQLTNADLIWRHETEDDLYRTIAGEIGISKNEFVEMIKQF